MSSPRLGILFGLLGLCVFAIGISRGDFWLVLAWLGIDFLLLAWGYFLGSPAIFGKTSHGTLPIWSKILFFPYLLYAGGIWHLARLVSREPKLDQVTDGVVVGRRLFASEWPGTCQTIVDLTSEFEEPAGIRSQQGYQCFPLLDAGAPTSKALLAFIESIPPGSVFIHCAQGHGRTGLVAAALLLNRGLAGSIDEALALLKKSRPGISLNKLQLECLRNFVELKRDSHCAARAK